MIKNNNIIKESSEQHIFHLTSILNKVKQELTKNGFDKTKVNDILKEFNFDIKVEKDNILLMCNNTVFVSKPINTPFFSFINDSVNAIINIITDKFDEIYKPIDVDLNIYNENKRYMLRLTEDDLHKIIKESVKNENYALLKAYFDDARTEKALREITEC